MRLADVTCDHRIEAPKKVRKILGGKWFAIKSVKIKAWIVPEYDPTATCIPGLGNFN
jgi:hypothetical protein